MIVFKVAITVIKLYYNIIYRKNNFWSKYLFEISKNKIKIKMKTISVFSLRVSTIRLRIDVPAILYYI